MTRAHLLLTSALVLCAAPARAQTPPAPNQLPAGMRVIAGQAAASTSGNTLRVTQGSNRAALDWSSFNIGSAATVRFQDPSAQAMTLNRVSGPNASVIAGRLTSNGQMVLINQSGVVFMPGAVVDAQSVVISASGITEQGMRDGVATGHFVLDQPAHPGAVIQNSGQISVRRAGLAALVAPQVANHGSISAAFGRVSLLGVSSHVVDLYGDGLLSIDVSRQTIQGADGEAALVTNDGVITAQSGQVTLSTAAVDGLVTNLVEAGGSISTDSAGRHGGRVLVDAAGGTATVSGTISAQGVGAGSSVGGEIAVRASELVNIASSARINASGTIGGGTVAIGTTLARARGGVGVAAPTAKLVGIADGAVVAADAIEAGEGGRITVLSSENTVMEGLLSTRGGAVSGDGGNVEVSGTLGLSLLGGVDVRAPHGNAGGLTIDPTDLVVETGRGGATLTNGTLDVEPPPADNTAIITPTTLQGAVGNVTLISHDNIDVLSGFSLNSNGLLTMTATTGTITVGGAITNNGGGIVMSAGSDIFLDAAISAVGSISITSSGGAITQAAGAPIASSGSFVALSATGLITLNDLVSSNASVNLVQASGVVQNAGSITAPALFSSGVIGGAVSLVGGANSVASIGAFTATGGFALTDTAASVTLNGAITVTDGPITILASAGALAVDAALSTVGTGVVSLTANTDVTVAAPVTAADALAITAAEGSVTGAIVQDAGGALTSTNNAIALSAGSSIELNANVTATNASNGSVNFEHGAILSLLGGVTQNAGSIATGAVFSSSGIGGSVSLTQGANSIDSLGEMLLGGSLALVDSAPTLTIAGPVQVASAQTISLVAPQITIVNNEGDLIAPQGTVELSPVSGAVTLGATGSGFSLTQSDLDSIATGLLRIGKTAVGGQASSVTVAGNFDLTVEASATALELDGGAGGIVVNAGSLVVGNSGTLLLGTSGTVSQAAGAVVDAGTLGGVGTLGALELSSTLNTIGTLQGIETGSAEINVGTSGGLALVGPIATTGGLTLNAAGSISLTGALSAGTLSLTTQPSDGGSDVVWATSFSAGTIEGSVSGSVSLIDSNTGTTTLGALSAFNNIALTTSGPLTTSGAVGADNVTLAATGLLAIDSAVTGFTIDLSAGTLTEDATAGSLNAIAGEGTFGLLTSTGGISGNATLLGANTLTQIGTFTAGGTLSLLNTNSLVVASGVGAASAAFRVTNGGSLEFDQPVTIPAAGTLSLRADNVRVTAGATSDVVSNTTGGTIELIAVAPNSAKTLALGGAAVTNASTLAVSNVHFLLNALHADTLELGGLPDGSLTASGIVVPGASLAAGVTLLLDTDATGGLTQTAALTVDTLGGDIGTGGMTLTSTGNDIAGIGGLAVGGSATLVDAVASLTVAGAFSAASGGTLAIAVDGFGIGAGGSLSAGTVAIGPLTAGHSLGIADPGASYAIELGSLGRITATTLDAGSSGIAGAATALSVNLAGNATFGGTLVLDAGAGGVTQSAGTLSVGALAGSSPTAAFDISDGSLNSIPVLDAILATSINIDDSSGVQVAGVVSATGGVLGLSAPSVTVETGGSLVATGGTLGLDTDALSGFGAGAVSDAGTVAIAPYSNAALTVGPAAGHVDLSVVSAATIELSSNSHGIAFSGAVVPGAATLLLQASNAPVTETSADSLTVGTLEGSAGSLSMPGGNAVGTLAGFTVGLGDFLLDDASLTVTAPVVASNASAAQTIALQAPTITLGAAAQFSTAFTSASAGLVLQSDTLTGSVLATVPGGTVLLERLTAGAQSFAQSGGITAGTLQVGGTIAGSSSLSATSLSLGDLITLDVATLLLETSGAVSQTGSLVLPTGTLAGQAGSVLLTASGNALAALGSFATTGGGAFALTDAAPLAVVGSVSAGAGTLTLTDTAAVTTGVSLEAGSSVQAAALVLQVASAGVTQDSAGVFDVTALSGQVQGDLLLAGTADSVASIGSLSVVGQFLLDDVASLTEATTGTLAAGTLEGTFSGNVTLDGTANAIATLGAITADGTLALTDASPILAGLVQATDISLLVNGVGYASGTLLASGGTVEIAPRDAGVLYLGAAPGSAPFVAAGVLANVGAAKLVLGKAEQQTTATGIAVDASVVVSSQVATVDLEASGPVTEAPGVTFGLSGTLVGNSGAVSLTGGANAVPTLGAYSVSSGDFALDDSGALAVEGNVSAADIALNVAGLLTLDAGSLLAGTGTVDLTATGASEISGIVQAGVLDSSGTPAGTFALGGANQVTALGTWNATGALTLNNVQTLTVTGPVTVTALGLSAPTITLAGNVTAGGAVTLATTAGGVTQSGGTLSAGSLSGTSVAGNVVLDSTGNAVASVGPFSAAGHSFTLTDASPLGVVGTLAAASVLLTDSDSITVSAPVVAPLITLRGGALAIDGGGVLLASGGTVDVVASGATESGTGVIQAATLLSGGTPSGDFVLGGDNSIDTLGNFQMASGGSLLLVDGTGLTIGGTVVAAGVDLSTIAGGVTETSGSIATSLLSSSFGIAGGVTLDNAGNAIAALGGIAVGSGDFSLAQSGSLSVVGTVSAADIAIRIGGALQIAGTGTLQDSGTIDLTADGASEAASGVIAAGVLESSQGASGAFFLTGSNHIGQLGPFSDVGGALFVTDADTLAVDGPINVSFLDLAAPALNIDGPITAPGMQVATTAGGLTQDSDGILTVELLSSPQGIAGAVSLPDANQIAALGSVSAQGAVALTDDTDLAIIGAVSAPAGFAITVTGNLTEGAQGSVATSVLSGSAASAALTQTGNAIAALDFATTGSLELADSQSLTVSTLSDLGASLAVTGGLTLAGNVAESSLLTLNANGAVVQTGGVVSALQLDGTASSFSLTASNTIDQLANIVAPGGFSLVDSTGLSLVGPVQGGVIDLSVASGGIQQSPNGTLTGTLRSSGGIVGSLLLSAANQLTAIGPLTVQGTFELADTQALTVGNLAATVIDLSTTAGGISQDGPLTVSVLQSTGGIAGGADFAGLGNAIATLGPMSVTGGDLALATNGNLTVAGPVSAPDVTLGVAGNIGQVGDIVAPGTFSTNTTGSYARSSGVLSVGTLSGSAGSFADFGTAAAVLTLGAFAVHDNDDPGYPNAAAASTLSIADGTAMTLAGPVAADYVGITATGTLVWTGQVVTLGLPRLQQDLPTLTEPGSYLQVLAGAGGTAQMLQTGLAQVISQDATVSTLRLQTPAVGGNIVFNDLQATDTDLLLFIGAGHASGSVDVGDLLVSGAQGGTSLVGTVRGLFGDAAARQSNLTPNLNANYQINSCPIQSVNCILLPVETVPQQNPLRDLAIGQARDELDDTDVLLPDVAEQDY